MGDALSRQLESSDTASQKHFSPNRCRYETLKQLQRHMQAVGFEACELIIAIDFTKANSWNGRTSFNEKGFAEGAGPPNLYAKALSLIATRLAAYDDDHTIPCYGFGDSRTGKDSVFSFFPRNEPAPGLESLLERYQQILPLVSGSGLTSFAPLIRQATLDVYNSGMKFHVLLILADGEISPDCLEDTRKAIIQACAYPLSIVVVGVGNGPWTEMRRFDTELPERSWDNFHFFEFGEVSNRVALSSRERLEEDFEFNVIAELPEQYIHARTLTGEANKSKVSHLVNSISTDCLIDPPSTSD